MLEDLNEESKSERQNEAKTDCEHRPMASAAMLAHFKELYHYSTRAVYSNCWGRSCTG
jgi:hypothetical protein